MKVSISNIKELNKHLEDLKLACDSLIDKGNKWVKEKEFYPDPYFTSIARSRLDQELDNIVDYLGWFYDYMHTERRGYEIPTGKYLERIKNATEEGESGDLQPVGNDGAKESSQRPSEESNDLGEEIFTELHAERQSMDKPT